MRSLVLAMLLTSCGDDSIPLPNAEVAVDDGLSATDAEAVLRDTSEVESTTTCVAPAMPAEIVVGRDDDRWCFEPLAAGATLEIVHGLQGGIHVELRLALASSSPEPPAIAFEVEVVHRGSTLARFAASLVPLEPLGAPETPVPGVGDGASWWATSAFPVVFASADATLYAGLDAGVRARVTRDGRVVDLAPLSVYLEDPSLPSPPR